LVARAIEWASQNGIMVSRAQFPNGKWFAYAVIMDSYYTYPAPGYAENFTVPSDHDQVVENYRVVEDVLADLDLKYTATVIFRQNDTLRWDAGYNLTYWDAGKAALTERLGQGNELALGAYDFVNYGKIAKQSKRRAAGMLALGREAMGSVLGVEDPMWVFSFVPEEIMISDDAYLAAFNAGFDTLVGGIYKTDFPYDLYGSIYPYYLNGAYEEAADGFKPRAVVVENNFYFDAITESTDLFYWVDVYKRGGALITRLVPWGIYNLPITLARFEDHVEEIMVRDAEEDGVWWTTVGDMAQYVHDRAKVDLAAKSEDRGGTISVTVKNNGENAIEGFSFKVRLDDQSRMEYRYVSRPMRVKSVKEGENKLEEGVNYALRDPVEGRAYGALFVWADLAPGQEKTFEIKTSRGFILPWAQIMMFPIFILGVFLAWFLLVRKPKAPTEELEAPTA
jgi:hypothetical protein